MLHCWKCKKLISEEPMKIGFRTQCPHCEIDLHVCVNCRHYSPGKPNDCNVPGTPYIKDREVMNFCEDFSLKTPTSYKPKDDIKNHFKSLFKDEEQ